jgi:hypothetical protein
VLAVLAGLLARWEDGLVAGPAALLVAYTISLTAGGRQPLSLSAPLVAAALLAVVDLGSWSLELREGSEQHPLAHLRTLTLLIVAAFASSLLVLVAAGAAAGGGIAVLGLGAAAAFGLFGLLRSRTTT